jgi:hypothetical protein
MLFVKIVRTVMIAPQGRTKHKMAPGLAHSVWRIQAVSGGKLQGSNT